MLKSKLENLLLKVEKPARYIGNEFNSVHKSHQTCTTTFAFCFPDTYEVGMSHLGMKILYHMLNDMDSTLCERVFSPWVDMEALLREENIPLTSLESQTPLCDFDILGFTLQYELSYTNILNMLDLGKIPFKSNERTLEHPFICAGGPCAYNPEPLADFIDFFVLGEGEEVVREIIGYHKEWKFSGMPREDFLKKISKIEGVYVPSFYDVFYNDDNTIKYMMPQNDSVPAIVKKRIIKNLDKTYVPQKLIVPFLDIVHDRIVLEVFRGCVRGCRFCQAGYIYRPVRERTKEELCKTAQNCISATGYEEISLSSLSTSDYTDLHSFIDDLLKLTEDKKVSLSLPSLRVDNFSIELMQKVQKVKKSGLTFAPEAGSKRLRDVINKNVEEEDLIRTSKIAFSGGYSSIKLYFMIGLPTETMEDVLGISELAKKVVDAYATIPKELRGRGVRVTVSTSSFVPKPFTPFQWEPQNHMTELIEKQKYLKENIKHKNISYNWHQSETSFLEAVFAKGGRRLCDVLVAAHKLGCKFDGWSEIFRYDLWKLAFESCGVDPEFYALRKIPFSEVLPWDHIDIGVSKDFLISEHQKALSGLTTPSCREKCSACGANTFESGVCFE